MHQIRFPLGLRPIPHWRTFQRTPDSLAVFQSSYFEDEGGEIEAIEIEKERRRRGEEGGRGKRREEGPVKSEKPRAAR